MKHWLFFIVSEVLVGNTKKAKLLKINKIKNSETANLECIYWESGTAYIKGRMPLFSWEEKSKGISLPTATMPTEDSSKSGVCCLPTFLPGEVQFQRNLVGRQTAKYSRCKRASFLFPLPTAFKGQLLLAFSAIKGQNQHQFSMFWQTGISRGHQKAKQVSLSLKSLVKEESTHSHAKLKSKKY